MPIRPEITSLLRRDQHTHTRTRGGFKVCVCVRVDTALGGGKEGHGWTSIKRGTVDRHKTNIIAESRCRLKSNINLDWLFTRAVCIQYNGASIKRINARAQERGRRRAIRIGRRKDDIIIIIIIYVIIPSDVSTAARSAYNLRPRSPGALDER